jgi:hypothetical protein
MSFFVIYFALHLKKNKGVIFKGCLYRQNNGSCYVRILSNKIFLENNKNLMNSIDTFEGFQLEI